MLKNSSIWLIVLMGIFGGIGIRYLSENWMASFFGVALTGLSFFIGTVMGILFAREQRKVEGNYIERTQLENQQKMIIDSLLAQREAMVEASEMIARGVGSSVAVKMVDEIFENKDNREQVDSVLTRAQEIVDSEVEEAYRNINK